MLDKIFNIITKEFKESVEISDECNCIFVKDVSKWNKIADFIVQNDKLKCDFSRRRSRPRFFPKKNPTLPWLRLRHLHYYTHY